MRYTDNEFRKVKESAQITVGSASKKLEYQAILYLAVFSFPHYGFFRLSQDISDTNALRAKET